jgi:peptide-methionine (S)-S-oxide reductase
LTSMSFGWKGRRTQILQPRATPQPQGREIATLAGGCFWCLEAVYDELRGVEDVVSGYSGGSVPNPSYEMVCTGTTGHAEVVQITFDPNIISFKQILQVFFTIHDPTTLNRQGPDMGTQYRSAIFYHSPEQKAAVEQLIAELESSRLWDRPIVTEVTPFERFYPAETYHQEYFKRNPNQAYCRIVIEPKVAKFRKHFLDELKKTQ